MRASVTDPESAKDPALNTREREASRWADVAEALHLRFVGEGGWRELVSSDGDQRNNGNVGREARTDPRARRLRACLSNRRMSKRPGASFNVYEHFR